MPTTNQTDNIGRSWEEGEARIHYIAALMETCKKFNELAIEFDHFDGKFPSIVSYTVEGTYEAISRIYAIVKLKGS